MSNKPTSLAFRHRFRSGVLGNLVIEHVDHGNGEEAA